MRPAFASTKQAAAFALLLLTILLSPVLAVKSLLPPRREVYSSMNWRYGPFSYLDQQIFKEKGNIDIAFIGSSRMWAGIDTPYVQETLSRRLGRPATVDTFAWAWQGFDAVYFITQDLLEHRKVKMIVFDDEYWAAPHVAATRWFRFSENHEALQGMPVTVQANYYFAALLGMPRNLLSLMRSNYPEELVLPENDHWKTFYRAQNSGERMGALTVERGMSPKAPFIPFTPGLNAQSPEALIYSAETRDAFQFTDRPLLPWQLQFAKKFAALAKTHGVKLVYLHLQPPFSSNETNSPVIHEQAFWPARLDADFPMVGIPPARLFAGIGREDFLNLFYTGDCVHFNKNGQSYFTKIITPPLLQIYEGRPDL